MVKSGKMLDKSEGVSQYGYDNIYLRGKESEVVTVIRTMNLVAIAALVLLQVSCSKDCPVCPPQTTVTFVIGAGYKPAGPWSSFPTIGVNAAFVGDPVPKVDYFRVNDSLITPCDQGFPCFDVTLPAQSKDTRIRALVNDVVLEHTIVPPDSFYLIEPLQSVVPRGAPLTIRWSESEGSDYYEVSLLVTETSGSLYNVLYDTTYYSLQTTATVPAQVMVDGASLTFQLLAGRGPRVEAGDSANAVVGSFRGFITGVFNLGMFDRLIE
jgi:hypothetical protein